MRKKEVITCRFCGKKIDESKYVIFIVKSRCCVECLENGRKKFPNSIGVGLVEKMLELKRSER
jgi:hypothetical protein